MLDDLSTRVISEVRSAFLSVERTTKSEERWSSTDGTCVVSARRSVALSDVCLLRPRGRGTRPRGVRGSHGHLTRAMRLEVNRFVTQPLSLLVQATSSYFPSCSAMQAPFVRGSLTPPWAVSVPVSMAPGSLAGVPDMVALAMTVANIDPDSASSRNRNLASERRARSAQLRVSSSKEETE